MKYLIFLVISLNLISGLCQAQNKVITYVEPEGVKDNRNEYFVKLLALALTKTATLTNKFTLKTTIRMQQGRALHQLANGKNVDVVWSVTSKDREQSLLPIRIPLLKGLLGHRVLIIRKEDISKFSRVNNLDDLKKFIAGQGHDWPDTQILRANEIKVSTASNYDGLFSMLQAERFDFFPRGINEAWQEIEMHAGSGLVIEENILLYYPSPIYFFVNNKATSLANRIEKGLRLSIKDGSFDKLLYSHHKKMFEVGKLNQRRVIPLHNPLLPTETPLKNKTLWHEIH